MTAIKDGAACATHHARPLKAPGSYAFREPVAHGATVRELLQDICRSSVCVLLWSLSRRFSRCFSVCHSVEGYCFPPAGRSPTGQSVLAVTR